MSKRLSDVKIVKQQELKRAQDEKEDNHQVPTTNVRSQKYAQDLDLDVKKIGSSTCGVKIVQYTDAQTMAPFE